MDMYRGVIPFLMINPESTGVVVYLVPWTATWRCRRSCSRCDGVKNPVARR